MSLFLKRIKAPLDTETWWKTSFNQCIAINNGHGTVLPNCTGYAWGRFAEIMNGVPNGLPTSNAGDWYRDDTTHQKGSVPQLGAVLVLGQPGKAGHVAIVEEIYADGSILTSESGYGHSWSDRFWMTHRYPPSYGDTPNYTGDYYFIGFIYNPAVTSSTSSLIDISSPQHPAQKFVAEAEKHVGSQGHSWVMSVTGVGYSTAWCAATMCAVAITCGYDGIIMPRLEFWAAGFGKEVIETYGGQYFKGPGQGAEFTPQVGDIIEYLWGADVNDYPYYHTIYASDHVGVVKEVNGDTIVTIEGNTGRTYAIKQRNIHSSSIHWYARPNWEKVGGDVTSSGATSKFVQFGTLYQTESTREDASIREVCYLTPNLKPSITTTNIRLAAINYTTLLNNIIKVIGGGIVTEVPDNVDQLSPLLRNIILFFRSKQLCTAASIGILANMKVESDFRTNAVGNKSAYFGICMWPREGGRADRMKDMAGRAWSTNLTGQLNYLWSELTTTFSASILTPLRNVSNDDEGAKNAAEIYAKHFKPLLGLSAQIAKRRSIASEYWSKVIVGGQKVTLGSSSSLIPPSATSSDTSSAQGKITTQSGKVITQGTSVVIPSSVPQTGIIANYTDYNAFYGEWAYTQGTISQLWGKQGKPKKYGVATLNGYFLLACTLTFGTTGDIISVVLEDGTYFNAIIADSKGDGLTEWVNGEHLSKWGHYLGSEIDIIEWESASSSQAELRSGLQEAGWLNKKVSKIVNYGSWLDGSKS